MNKHPAFNKDCLFLDHLYECKTTFIDLQLLVLFLFSNLLCCLLVNKCVKKVVCVWVYTLSQNKISNFCGDKMCALFFIGWDKNPTHKNKIPNPTLRNITCATETKIKHKVCDNYTCPIIILADGCLYVKVCGYP